MREGFAVLFDMDGVIFDSEQAVLAVWRELAAELGLEKMEEVFLRCVGTNKARTKEIFRAAYPALDFARFDGEARRRFHSRWNGGNLPQKPGVRELLRALREQSVPLALASCKTGRLPGTAGDKTTCCTFARTSSILPETKPPPWEASRSDNPGSSTFGVSSYRNTVFPCSASSAAAPFPLIPAPKTITFCIADMLHAILPLESLFPSPGRLHPSAGSIQRITNP